MFSVVGKTHLERMSRFWPLVIGETIIFNMASVRQFSKGGGGGRAFNYPLFSLIFVNHVMLQRIRTLWNSFKNAYNDFLLLI